MVEHFNKRLSLSVFLMLMSGIGYAEQFSIRALESDKFEEDTGQVTPFTFVVERDGDLSQNISVRYWVREIGQGGNKSANIADFSFESVKSNYTNLVNRLLKPEGSTNVRAMSMRWDVKIVVKNDDSLYNFNWPYFYPFDGNLYTGIVFDWKLKDVIDVAAGESHATYLLKDNPWFVFTGGHFYGQWPVPGGAYAGGIDIDSGLNHTVLLKADGTVLGWGDADPGNPLDPPLDPHLLPFHEVCRDILAIAAGAYHTVALKADGTVVASDHGRNSEKADVPEGLDNVVAIAAGFAHTVALKADGTVVAWGDNRAKQVEVPEGLSDVITIAAGHYHTVALRANGTLINWGNVGISPIDLSQELDEIKDINAGNANTMILKQDGTLSNWGRRGDSLALVPEGMDQAVSIDAGAYHAVALKADGTVAAWGNNYYGQTDVPENLNGVTTIAAGYYHSVALRSDGTVVIWGDNRFGQAEVPLGLDEVTGIDAEAYYTAALRADGTVVAWGNEVSNQSLDPTGLSDLTNLTAASLEVFQNHMEAPEGLHNATAIAAGDGHLVALRTDGSVIAWGDNQFGQTEVPEGLRNVTAIAAGFRNTIALQADGTVVTWGSNRARFEGLRNITGVHAGLHKTLARNFNGVVHQSSTVAYAPWHYGLNLFTDIAGGERQLMFLESSLGSIDFAPGESSKLLTIDIQGDDVPESDERFTVMLLARAEEEQSGSMSARGVIRDDDHPKLEWIRYGWQNGIFSFSAARDDGTFLNSTDALQFVVRSTRDFRTWEIEPNPLVARNGNLQWESRVEPEGESRFFQIRERNSFRQ